MRKLAVVALLVAGGLALAGPAIAQDPTVAPTTSLSGDGRTVSGAGKTLSAGQVEGLDPAGQQVTVSGTGYDVTKGVYVTLCVIPPTNLPPTPCGGGQDRSGTSSGSTWVSSNPPDYAAGLTSPYGPDGTFDLTLTVVPKLNDTLDCFSVRCAIVTRNDHTRGSDRSQDLFLPVTFRPVGEPAPGGAVTTAPAPAPTVTTSSTVPPPSAVAPAATVTADGLSVGDGQRSLSASEVEALDPDRATVSVSGSGFDPAQGVYVALCRVPEVGAAPGPCTAGRPGAAWVSSHPPDYGTDLAEPFGASGGFAAELTFGARIDDATDCRVVACAIATRSDDTATADRRNDLVLPVTFAGASGSSTTVDADEAAARPSDTEDGDGGGGALIAAGAGGAALLGVAGALALRSRRRSAT